MRIVLRSAAVSLMGRADYCANQRGMDLIAPALAI
jgi:hypothetical protein